TSDFDTRTRGGHIATIAGGSVESPVSHKQSRVLHLHDSARRELDRRLHSDILSERFTNCANASRRSTTRHQESIECVQANKAFKRSSRALAIRARRRYSCSPVLTQ